MDDSVAEIETSGRQRPETGSGGVINRGTEKAWPWPLGVKQKLQPWPLGPRVMLLIDHAVLHDPRAGPTESRGLSRWAGQSVTVIPKT